MSCTTDRLGVDDAQALSRPLREQRRGLIYLNESASLPAEADRAILREAIVTLREVEDQLVAEPDQGNDTVVIVRVRLADRVDELHRILVRLGQRAAGE